MLYILTNLKDPDSLFPNQNQRFKSDKKVHNYSDAKMVINIYI